MAAFGDEEIRELGRRFLPKKAVDALLALAEPTIALVTRPVEEAAGHENRLGGRPKIEPDFSWPTLNGDPLSLLAVLDLGDVGAVAPEGAFGKAGYLNLFVNVGGSEAVADPSAIQGRVHLATGGLYEERPTPSRAYQAPGIAVELEPELSLPHPREPVVAELAERYGRKLVRAYEAFLDLAGAPRHRLLGWPDLIQEPIEPSLPKLRAGRWRLLAQLDSDDALAWSWGNVGRLFVMIPDRDLPKARFDRCRMVVQTYP